MGAGMSAFLVPIVIALHEAGGKGLAAFVPGPACWSSC